MNYTCTCDSGYAVEKDSNSSELHCGNVDDCGPEACGVGRCKDLVNDYECICPEGYKQVSETNGNTTDKTCVPVSCGAPPRVANSATTPLRAQTEKASYKKTIVYQCDNGYTQDAKFGGKNHFSIQCQANKQFTKAAECNPIKCDKVS